ncbi:MAG: hypothetical protein K6G60_07100 [Lachnospiraceae bacterium]|nr:hypothetical protein [Lachnospiraceae bacterium]
MNKVIFKTEDERLQRLFDEAEKRLQGNLRDFAGRSVLVEGAGYEKIWLETQPMGGEMFCKRDNSGAALNNQLLFMENQRSDGRLPGSIKLDHGKVVPEYNKLQGFCFPEPALNMYYLTGEDREYLDFLGATLEKFDKWLWATRDSDQDGCLESFCVYDTGEDGAVRYGDAPNYWEKDAAPTEFASVPMASSDIMSWSFSTRNVLSKICRIKGKVGAADDWQKAAETVRKALEGYLWDEKRSALFDRVRNHEMQKTLTHATLKAMYWGSISNEKADAFVKEHLLNEKEFWTYMPIPAVAANDPDFRNIPENNWSGQCESLIYQRAIRALENYGWDRLIPMIGEKIFSAVGENMAFVQQFDPFTGKPSLNEVSGGQPTYGPAILSVLEYLSRIYGLHREGNMLYWGLRQGPDYEYVQVLNDVEYRICHTGRIFECHRDGVLLFSTGCDGKAVTDVQGKDPKMVMWQR